MKKSKNILIQPNLDWYKKISSRYKLPFRCPYVTIYKCPRYYLSISLLGKKGITTPLDKEEDEKCYKTWKKSELWPKRREEEPSIMGTETSKIYRNFCPEVVFEIFGLFATNLSEYASELGRNIAHKELAKIKASKDDWKWYWSSISPQHYTDCLVYSLLERDSINKGKININLSRKQEKDYEKYGYICKDRIYIPGTPSVRRNCIILLNDKETKIKDANFLLLLRFVVELKKGKGGKVHINDLEKDKIIPSRKYYQYIDRLNDDLKVNIMFCKDNKKDLIESLGAGYYQISTHPDFVDYNLDNLLNYPDDSRIRELAMRLEEIEKNL